MLQLVNGLTGVESLELDFPKKLGENDGKPFFSKGKRLYVGNQIDCLTLNRKCLYKSCVY